MKFPKKPTNTNRREFRPALQRRVLNNGARPVQKPGAHFCPASPACGPMTAILPKQQRDKLCAFRVFCRSARCSRPAPASRRLTTRPGGRPHRLWAPGSRSPGPALRGKALIFVRIRTKENKNTAPSGCYISATALTSAWRRISWPPPAPPLSRFSRPCSPGFSALARSGVRHSRRSSGPANARHGSPLPHRQHSGRDDG
jgi:hypothetical protein